MRIYVGEAINETSDYFGKAGILAARIAAIAQGNQILVSSTLYDLVANAGDLRFVPMDEKQRKVVSGLINIRVV
jgi:class 3 adenylate cyclase